MSYGVSRIQRNFQCLFESENSYSKQRREKMTKNQNGLGGGLGWVGMIIFLMFFLGVFQQYIKLLIIKKKSPSKRKVIADMR